MTQLCYEELKLSNESRPTEIHTLIVWDPRKKDLVQEELKKILPETMKIIHEQPLEFTPEEESQFDDSLYGEPLRKMVNRKCYLFILKDEHPILRYSMATRVAQVMNHNMYIIKNHLRDFLVSKDPGMDRTRTIHGTYNQEETLLVLKPLGLEKWYQRPGFTNLSHLLSILNQHPTLQYLIYSPTEDILEKNQLNFLVNDYYLFKNLTGSLSRNTEKMRARDDGWCVDNSILIHGHEMPVTIRYPGDRYVDHHWEKEMLRNRILRKTDDLKYFVPASEDRKYLSLYQSLVQKKGDEMDESEWERLVPFMINNNYRFWRPKDLSVDFRLRDDLEHLNGEEQSKN